MCNIWTGIFYTASLQQIPWKEKLYISNQEETRLWFIHKVEYMWLKNGMTYSSETYPGKIPCYILHVIKHIEN